MPMEIFCYYDTYNDEICYVDIDGEKIEKEPKTDTANCESIEWLGNYLQSDSAVYSDRLYQWDTKKYKKCYKEVFSKYRYFFRTKNISGIEEFLRLYFNKKIELTAIIQGRSYWTEIPYSIFFYRELN